VEDVGIAEQASLRARAPMVVAHPAPGMEAALTAAGFRAVRWPEPEEEAARLMAWAPEIEAMVTTGPRPLPEGFLDRAGALRLICCLGAGYESFDPDALAARGIRLANGAGANAEDVADLALGLFLAARRRIVEADGRVRAGLWRAAGLRAHRLRGGRMGVIGMGAIGHAVAVRAEAFGMAIGWCGPSPKPVAWPRFDDALALARWSDALVVCARPTPENDGLVGDALLDALGPAGVLVNVARGTLVDEGALVRALREGRLGAAALDVFAEEPTDPATWDGVPNLTLHPHSGGATVEALDACRDLAVENIRRCFAGEPLVTPLN
jgi:lactate dehydrogenase-like 2-hydroxyacid dehydrogenase